MISLEEHNNVHYNVGVDLSVTKEIGANIRVIADEFAKSRHRKDIKEEADKEKATKNTLAPGHIVAMGTGAVLIVGFLYKRSTT